MDLNIITGEIIGCAIEVHRNLGPGLLESTYEQCLCYEPGLTNLSFKSQLPLYKKIRSVNLCELCELCGEKLIYKIFYPAKAPRRKEKRFETK